MLQLQNILVQFKCIFQMMFNRVNLVIGIQFDYTWLICNKRQFWNRSSCYSSCRFYNTLKQSWLLFRTIRKFMAYLTRVNTSICPATFVVFVGNELVLGFILRVVILRLWHKARSTELRLLVINVRLRWTLKISFGIFWMPPRNLTARSTFAAIIPKFAVTAITLVTNTDMRAYVRWHRQMCLTLILTITKITRPRNFYGNRTPQTTVDNIVLQSN